MDEPERNSLQQEDVILSAAAAPNPDSHWSRAAAEGSIAGARIQPSKRR